MKTHLISISLGVAASVFGASTLAESTTQDRPHGSLPPITYPADAQGYHAAVSMGDRASKLIGAEVRNMNGTKVAKIHDLAVDLHSGKVMAAIISAGGVLGVGDRLVAAPLSIFTVDTDQHVHTEIGEATFKNAPVFDPAQWNESTLAGSLAAADEYYAQSRNSADRPAHPHLQATEGLRPTSASKLLGITVKNPQDETVGKVDELVIHWSAGRLAEVVVAAGGFLGAGEELNAIPPSFFTLDAEKKVLLLNVAKDELAKAPRFSRTEWAQVGSSSNVVEVYNYYRVAPYFKSAAYPSTLEADNSARNTVDRIKALPTPLEQGNSQADLDVTRNIRKDLQLRSDLSVNAQNVKVITLNGQVTLRGPVESEAEKTTLQQVASKYVPASSIDNRTVVKTDTNR